MEDALAVNWRDYQKTTKVKAFGIFNTTKVIFDTKALHLAASSPYTYTIALFDYGKIETSHLGDAVSTLHRLLWKDEVYVDQVLVRGIQRLLEVNNV